MKKLLTIVLLVFASISAIAQLNYQWAFNPKSIYAPGGDVVGSSIKIDAAGNSYVTGFFQGTADFDPSDGVVNLTSKGGFDIFIAKYDGTGNLVFCKSMGGINDDEGNSISLDGSGNIYIIGYFSDTTDFDPGAGITNLVSTGGTDIFIAKYDGVGNYIFAKGIGGHGYDDATSLAIDASSNLCITGYFKDTVDFDPGAGIANLFSFGSNDIFIAKYDAMGNYIYAKSMGGTSDDEGTSITPDASNNVYITGYFQDTVDFDPGAGIANLYSLGIYDAFIAKYDVSGNYIFAKGLQGTGNQQGNAITIDISGNICVTGKFNNTVDFDPGAGIANLTATTVYQDMFLAKYDANGNYIYAIHAGGYGYAEGDAITTDLSGNTYVMGLFHDSCDFDPGVGIAILYARAINNPDIFLAKYDASGNYLYAISLAERTVTGSESIYSNYSVAIDNTGNAFVTGDFFI